MPRVLALKTALFPLFNNFDYEWIVQRAAEQESGRKRERGKHTKRPRRSASHINNNKVGHLIGFCAALGTANSI